MPLEVQFNKNERLDDIKAVKVQKPSISNDVQVLIKFLLNPINPSDVLSIKGLYNGFQPDSYPAVPGIEGLALVEEIGNSVTTVKVGQRVIIVRGDMSGGVTKVGTWRNYAIYNQENLHPVPDNVSDEAAAQAIVNPVTAYAMLDQLNIPKGEYLLQTAAGSALGRILIQFANRRGVKTINLVRRKEQIEELKNIGADEVLFTDGSIDIVDKIKSITNGRLAYAAVDAVGGDLGIKLSQSVKDSGHILLYGALGGSILSVSAIEVLYRNVQYSSFALSRHFKSVGKDKFIDQLNKVFELFGSGIEPIKAVKFPLQQISKALEESSKPGKSTKVLLVHS